MRLKTSTFLPVTPIQPVSQASGDIKSSGALLLSVLGNEMDEHSRELCMAADAADKADFTTHFGGLVNKAVKSAIADDRRRIHLTNRLAQEREPDEVILGWIAEYDEILASHEQIVATKEDLGNGVIRLDATGKKKDMTSLMSSLYGEAKVVIVASEAFNKALGCNTLTVSFGTGDRSLDILRIIKGAVPTASGFAQKANLDPEYEGAALAAIRQALS